jgi:hypothetical protein
MAPKLGIAGARFTLDGAPTFLLWISYYAGLGGGVTGARGYRLDSRVRSRDAGPLSGAIPAWFWQMGAAGLLFGCQPAGRGPVSTSYECGNQYQIRTGLQRAVNDQTFNTKPTGCESAFPRSAVATASL